MKSSDRIFFPLFFFPLLLLGQSEKDIPSNSANIRGDETNISNGSILEVDTICYTSISALIDCLLKHYSILYASTYIDCGETEMDYQVVKISGSLNHLAIRKFAWEYEQSEYQFYDININDFKKLLSGITLGGKEYEYLLMNASEIAPGSNSYQWENEYDDWVRSVFLEECQPKGTRLTIVGSL